MPQPTPPTWDIIVSIKSHNPIEHMRMELLEDTVVSARKAFPQSIINIFANGATDGSLGAQFELQRALPAGDKRFGLASYCARNVAAEATPGHGMLAAADQLYTALITRDRRDESIGVFSDDDMVWREGTADRVVQLWANAPDDLLIVSGLFEPVWPWNTPREAIDCGTERVLVRDSCPGAAWTLRMRDWPTVRKHIVTEFGFDSKACASLLEAGYRVGAIDVAEHAGALASTHGNNAMDDVPSRPIDRAKWGLV